MTIQVGDPLPQVTFRVMTPEGPAARTTDDIFKGRKVVLVGVPGAFTPTCHRNHLPGYVEKAQEIRAKASGAESLEFLADGNGEFARAIGLSLDRTGFGLGIRSQRYAMIVEDGVIEGLHIEEATSQAEVSGAENLLKGL
jgi:peroxiredoxin